MDAGLKLGADVIVNTDADNQYEGDDVPKLVAPIIRGEADMVVGDRQVETIEHFSGPKKLLQRLGSWVVRQASSTELPDTTSGFRAYNREAALQVQAVSKFTYTLETIIQAGKLLVAVEHVPIRTNPKTRESRLFPSTAAYVRRNALSIFRIYSQYQPLKVFWGGAVLFGTAAVGMFTYFIVDFISRGGHAGHVQLLIAGAVLFNAAMLLGALGVIGDLLDAQRIISQRTFERVRRIELQLGVQPSHYEPGSAPSPPPPGGTRPEERGQPPGTGAPDREALGV
jgi:glycosyltransferase involved in cell wall biosynthesis